MTAKLRPEPSPSLGDAATPVVHAASAPAPSAFDVWQAAEAAAPFSLMKDANERQQRFAQVLEVEKSKRSEIRAAWMRCLAIARELAIAAGAVAVLYREHQECWGYADRASRDLTGAGIGELRKTTPWYASFSGLVEFDHAARLSLEHVLVNGRQDLHLEPEQMVAAWAERRGPHPGKPSIRLSTPKEPKS